MKLDRRNFLLVAATAAAADSSRSAQAGEKCARVSQSELDEAIKLHGWWLSDAKVGRRCMFAYRNLSGLRFGTLNGIPVNLSGADFAQADLSGTEADDILVHNCCFNGAKFDGCHWRRPVFASADMRRASAKGVKWGSSDPRCSEAELVADFAHTALNDSDLTAAKIFGSFYGTRMGGACLLQTDLSRSEFLGPMHHEMSFAGAQLCDARLHDCRLSSVSLFNADCSGADFSRSVLSDVQMKGCNLRGACFSGAEIRRTKFSADQIAQVDFLPVVG
jgi:uncharacterized protein YjbI with pentapeptide repeats